MTKNPFPGMNPYLEASWGDVHTRLTTYASDQLNEQLPNGLQARVEEAVSIDYGDEEVRRTVAAYPDTRVVERPEWSLDTEPESGAVAVATPVFVKVIPKHHTRHIEIVDHSDGARVVTAIEFLSMSNKLGPGRAEYLKKQRRYLDAGVNLVEIDLLRDGPFVLAVNRKSVPRACRQPYRCCIRRALRSDRAEMFPMPLQAPLPTIPIPLRKKDKDVVLPLQQLINDAIRKGRYSTINYQELPDPPLSADDEQWADALLREAGLRK